MKPEWQYLVEVESLKTTNSTRTGTSWLIASTNYPNLFLRYGSIEVVYQTANPIIRNNVIHHNRGYGIHVHTLSRPIIQGNTIHDNESDGISCWGGADPYVTGNKIMRNRGDGVYIHEDGKGVFENNEIFNQKLDGIRTSKSCPSLINNSIHNNDGTFPLY